MHRRLLEEEQHVEKLNEELSEAACIGQLLVSKNEELERELEELREQLRQQDFGASGHTDIAEHSRTPTCGLSVDGGSGKASRELTPRSDDHRTPRSITPTSGSAFPSLRSSGSGRQRSLTPCRVGPSLGLRSLRAKTSSRSHSTQRRHSVHVLANEYDTDLQDLVAENKRLTSKASELEQNQQDLSDRLQEALAELANERASSSKKAEALEKAASASELAQAVARHHDLRSELDSEQARSWELEQLLLSEQRHAVNLHEEVAAALQESQEHQHDADSRAEEVDVLRARLEELSDVAAESRRASEEQMNNAHNQAPDALARSRIETYGRSLSVDMRSHLFQGGPEQAMSPRDLALLREIDELRVHLVNAELTLQRREAARFHGEDDGGDHLDGIEANQTGVRKNAASTATANRPHMASSKSLQLHSNTNQNPHSQQIARHRTSAASLARSMSQSLSVGAGVGIGTGPGAASGGATFKLRGLAGLANVVQEAVRGAEEHLPWKSAAGANRIGEEAVGHTSRAGYAEGSQGSVGATHPPKGLLRRPSLPGQQQQHHQHQQPHHHQHPQWQEKEPKELKEKKDHKEKDGAKDGASNSIAHGKFLVRPSWPDAFRSSPAIGQR